MILLEDKLERAIKNENSREAKKLNEKFSGLLRVVGGNTPWSSLERRSTLGKLKALCGFFGLPSIFLTIAPCIADSEIANAIIALKGALKSRLKLLAAHFP